MLGINPQATHVYIPRCDRDLPKEKQTRFLIRAMTAKTRERLENNMAAANRNGGVDVFMGSAYYNICKEGLVGWENFRVPNEESGAEEDVEFKTITSPFDKKRQVPTDETMSYIPSDIRKEIADVIENERFTPEDLEKSASPSGSTSET